MEIDDTSNLTHLDRTGSARDWSDLAGIATKKNLFRLMLPKVAIESCLWMAQRLERDSIDVVKS
jgi:hypothetical protein